MADLLPTSSRGQNVGRNFISSVLQRLPYVAAGLDVSAGNPKYELFDRLAKRTDFRLLSSR